METVAVVEPKKKLLEYKLNKEIQFSKKGEFKKTKTLYCIDPKEIKWADIGEYEENFYNLMDLIEVYEKKGQALLPQEKVTDESIAQVQALQKEMKEKLTHEELIAVIAYNKLGLAKEGGMPTYKLLEYIEKIIEKFMFADEELTVPVTKDDVKRGLGLQYMSIAYFFLGEAIIPYFVSETQRPETI